MAFLHAEPAAAAPMRVRARVENGIIYAGIGPRWEPFYERALRTGQRNIHVPNALNYLTRFARNHGGLLPNTAMVDYLQWRRSFFPKDFDRIHPVMGPLLARDQLVTGTQKPPPPPTKPPAIGGEVITNPPAVPEPSTTSLAIALVAFATVWRTRNRIEVHPR